MDARSICLQKICAFQVLLMKGMVPVKRDADKVAGMLAHHALQSIYFFLNNYKVYTNNRNPCSKPNLAGCIFVTLF